MMNKVKELSCEEHDGSFNPFSDIIAGNSHGKVKCF